ncbi:hypothetical protein F4553_001673 [Allocatelliglobosispora scoriae]|uniref:Lipoprotein n=1 Tax=Allocatelliglobosispora scoriae TaxID=643052 RepID=A0A841BJ60_9ACTN|nr:hypothetical protein [Allocatelliglobosispora scoriae]MBB5868294.1 hypothetical protein [Allocatelliglobosispora scoriae]
MGSWGRLVLGSVLLVAGCTAAGSPAPTPGAATTPAGSPVATGCGSKVETGSLPDWADAGFSGDAKVPHVFGAKGSIVGVLFGYPLQAGRTDGTANKILWVGGPAPTSDTSAPDTLVITATLDGTATTVVREVAGGPGPSITDMPQAGCWHLELRWSGRTDTMDLTYGAPASTGS